MEFNGSSQPKNYDRGKGILGDYGGRGHFEAADSERRQWRTKRKFPSEGQAHVPPSFTRDQRFNGFYDGNMLPPGWLDCPAYGQPVDRIIPSKVPLGASFNEHISGKRYTPKHVIYDQRQLGREIGLVIDLTNTNRYYPLSAWLEEGIRHVKIRCKGRDSVPDDASVDKFVLEVSQYCSQQTQPEKFILVHCTHGHNRTGYMIAHFLKLTKSISVTDAIQIFAKARPPGIYKDDYIDSLYSFYHEKRPELVICPRTPEWKGSSDPDLIVEAMQEHKNTSASFHENYMEDQVMTNDDLLGDTVSSDQLRAMRQTCYQLLNLGIQARGNLHFPGSHPVSLNRDNLQLLRQRYYYATWKADGTRYMMLITLDGCYLIDRNFLFRRVDMRFPCKNTNKVYFLATEDSGVTYVTAAYMTDDYSLCFFSLRVCLIRPITALYLMEKWLLTWTPIHESKREDISFMT